MGIGDVKPVLFDIVQALTGVQPSRRLAAAAQFY
jgi:hypothetical protein